MKRGSLASLLLVVIVAVAACAAPATPVPPTAVPTAVPPTAAPTAAPMAKEATLKVVQDATLGQFLADDQGRTLYLFTKDTKNTSNCYDNCAKAWPPLSSAGQPQGMDGVTASLLGTTQRKDGTLQVTYNGYPLYYFAKDQKSGDTTGQGVGDVWYVVSPAGEMVKAATVKVVQDATLGQFLADDQGRTLYLFTKDTKNTSNCYDNCAKAWPPLLSAGQPKGMEGVTASLLGITQRKEGTSQVTYNGYPLYYFAKDQKSGDTTGQGVGDVWYVVSPAGEMVKSAMVTTGGSAGATPAAMADKPAMLKVVQNDALGQFLADDQGRTLYLFTKDTMNTSNCYDQCAVNWPALLTKGDPVAGEGVDGKLLGTTQRKDGSTQVTYNGLPLYYYIKDQKPGDTTGQEVGGVWYVISPKGEKVEK